MRKKIIDEEIKINPKKFLFSRTDEKGVIVEANDYFSEISGYSNEELVGAKHNIIRHPDMPKIIFKVMWDRIRMGKNIKAIVKNRSKDGRYYWVVTDFEPKYDHTTQSYTAHSAFRRSVPKESIKAVEPLYDKLLDLESKGGIKASEEFLKDFLASKNIDYDEFVEDMAKNKSILGSFFGFIGKFFGGK